MVSRWLLAFTLSLQVTFAIGGDLPSNPRNDTPAQSLKRLQNNFKSQANYDAGIKRNLAELDSRIYMNEGTRRASVEQMLTRSGVLESGAKAQVVAKVTQPADTGKAAKTLADRLGKAKDYAKHAGKSSIPAFLGGAAVQALVDGVGWVMDEGGKVTKKDDSSPTGEVTPLDEYGYVFNGKLYQSGSLAADAYLKSLCTFQKLCSSVKISVVYTVDFGRQVAKLTFKSKPDNTSNSTATFERNKNDKYNPAHQPESTEVTQEQLAEALKNALDSNNPALAAAIAEAIKAAYSYDGNKGQDDSTNTIAIGTANDMNKAVDRAFDNPTPNATSDKPSGYYKIEDGEKTVEGYVYSTDPTGSITPKPDTGTGTEPGTGTGTGTGTSTGGATLEFPVFCEWAGIVCDFIDWVKQDEEIPEDEPEKIDESIFDRKFDINFDMGGSCPPNPTWSFEFVGQQWSKEINISSICDFFRYIGYAIVFASNMTALWIVYAAVTVREQG